MTQEQSLEALPIVYPDVDWPEVLEETRNGSAITCAICGTRRVASPSAEAQTALPTTSAYYPNPDEGVASRLGESN